MGECEVERSTQTSSSRFSRTRDPERLEIGGRKLQYNYVAFEWGINIPFHPMRSQCAADLITFALQ